MKSKSSAKRFPSSKSAWKKAIARAPRHVDDPESPYDPNDRAAVRAFWSKGKVRYPGQRGPQKAPTKTLVSLRLSQDVLAYFKATGPGWQTRIDETLKSAIESKAV
jgi:uncharacterized protein (DUF4415 family)